MVCVRLDVVIMFCSFLRFRSGFEQSKFPRRRLRNVMVVGVRRIPRIGRGTPLCLKTIELINITINGFFSTFDITSYVIYGYIKQDKYYYKTNLGWRRRWCLVFLLHIFYFCFGWNYFFAISKIGF